MGIQKSVLLYCVTITDVTVPCNNQAKHLSNTSDESDFPRNGGNTIPINFGQSLEALYSKPSSAKKRKANTILPVMSRNADTAEQGLRHFQ